MGLRIDVDTSRGISSLKDFRKFLADTGVTATATEREVKALEERFEKKLGADQAADALSKTRRQIEEIGRAADLSKGEIQGLSDRAGVLASKSSSLSSASGLLGGSFSSLALKIGTVVGAYVTLREAIEKTYEFVQRGISFNSQMESAALGISSVLAATQKITDLNGRRLEGQEKLNATMALSRDIMNDIQVMGLETTATTKEMVSGFQTLLGPAAEAGLTIKQTEQFVIGMVQAFGAVGIEMNQLSAEGRSLLDGTINPMQDRLATVLGISGEMVKSWKNQGKLFDNLIKKLEAFRLAGAATATTWEGLSSNMEEAFDLFAGKNTEGIFEGAKKGMADIVGLMFNLNDGSVQIGPNIQNIATGIQAISNDIGNGIATGTQLLIEKVTELNEWVGNNKDELSKIYTKTKDIALELADILGNAGGILTTIVSACVETGAFSAALSFAKSIVVIIQETVGYIELAFRALGLVVVKNVCGPLAQAARIAADLGKTKIGGMFMDDAQIASLEKYAESQDATIKGFEDALEKSASRYKYTPFPAITEANKDVENLNRNIDKLKKSSSNFKILPKTGYTEADSAKLLGGISTAQSSLNDAWKKGQSALSVLDAKLKQNNLTSEERTRALNDQKQVWQYISDAQESFEKGANRGSKAAKNAALAAERYGQAAATFYENTLASLDQLHDSLTGDTEKTTNRIDKFYENLFNQIRQRVIGAKGDVSKYAEVWVAAFNAWPGDRILAVLKDTTAELRKEASLLQDIADATGDPVLKSQAGTENVEAWYLERKQQILDLHKTAEEEASLIEMLEQAKASKIVQVNSDAYKDVGGISEKYWESERRRIEQQLSVIKDNSDDETAYKIYAAQQWDEYNKKHLEKQAQYSGNFADTFAAKWSLAFGGYESETTRAKKRWDTMSEGIIESTEGVVDGVSGGLGDILRMAGDTSTSIEDIVANLKSRLLDMLADMVERAAKMWLEDFLGRISGSGGGSGGADSLFTRYFSTNPASGSGGGGGSYSQSLASLQTAADYFGRSAGSSVGDALTSAAASGTNLFLGDNNALANIFSDGIDMSQLGSSTLWTSEAAQGAVSASTMAGTYSAAEVAAMSGTSLSSVLGTVLPVVGAIGGLVGLATSLFGETKEEIRKTAEGYNVAYSGGQTSVSGVDFYSDGSVVGTGVVDPDVTRQISDSFKDAAEAIDDAAENLGFSVDKLIENFTMPAMNITKDQLGDYIDAGTNLLAFQALEQAGLRGAFDALADDGQIYYDQIQEFSAAFSTVAGTLSAYGYEVRDVAQITQEQIDALRDKTVETAQGTSQAILTMAASMGATSDQLAELAANASDGSQALAVTDQQLENLLAADYAQDLLDAVGGEDAFASIMGNLTGNIFDSMGAYVENLSYYTDKATESIAKLGDGAVTIENFWTSFDAALKDGLTVDEFEGWGKASQWVANLDAINDAIADYNAAMDQYESSLEARLLKAQGRDDEADKVTMLADAEQELADAREAGYDAAILATIQAVQAAELAQKEAEISRTTWEAVEALAVREKRAAGDPYADASEAYFANGWAYQDATTSGLYTPEQLDRLKAVQDKELQQFYDDIAASVEENAQTAHARLLRAMGKDDEADLYEQQIAAAGDLRDALESNLYSAEGYADLVQAVALETQNLIEQQARDAEDYQTDIKARLLTAQGHSTAAALLTQAAAAEDDLLEARQKGIEGTQAYADLEAALALERANLIEEQAADERGAVAALNARLARSRGLEYEASVIEALADAEDELSDARDAGYGAATLALMRMVQAAEQARDALDHLNEIKSDWADLDARLYEAAGDDLNAGWARLVEQQREELYEAHRSGASEDYIAQLKEVQKAEREAKWAELIKDAIEEQTATLEDTLGDLTDQFSDGLASFMDILDEELQRVKGLASDAESTRKSLESTIQSLLYGEDSPLSAAEQVRSLGAQIEAAYRTMTTAGHGQARIDAAGTLQDLAADYLSALQATAGSSGDYLADYLDVAGKLREAESITGQEENYFERIADAEEAQQELFSLILEELRKDDPNTEKLQALLDSSGIMSGAITGIYNDQTSGEGANWRETVAGLLRDAGYADTDITAALGGPTSTGSFLAMLNEFNQQTMPGMINQILKLLNDIKNVAGDLNGPAPEVDPDDYPTYTDAEINWATNLRTAMNAQAYGGSTSWSVDDILSNLGEYVPWGAAYGITDTTGYVTPSTGDKQYYYAKTKQLNSSLYDDAESTWLDAQAAIAATYGSGNYAAHWLDAGYSEGLSFPKSDAVLYKTVQYLLSKWRNDGGASGDFHSPLTQAWAIEDTFGIGKSNAASALEAAARAHWDAGYGPQEGLIQPYRLGGDAPANSWGLVGEEGPELVRFNAGASLTSHTSSRALLGDAFERVFDRLIDEVKRLQKQNEELREALVAIATYTLNSSDLLRKFDTIGLSTRTAATGGN